MNPISRWIFEQLRDQRVRVLMEMPVDDLMALWDRYDGCNAPDGHEGEDIHMALNLVGHGSYCAV